MSSKIFGYMSFSTPVMHVYYMDEGINRQYLQTCPLLPCLKADEEQVRENARKLGLFLLWSHGRKFRSSMLLRAYGSTLQAIAKELESVVARV